MKRDRLIPMLSLIMESFYWPNSRSSSILSHAFRHSNGSMYVLYLQIDTMILQYDIAISISVTKMHASSLFHQPAAVRQCSNYCGSAFCPSAPSVLLWSILVY